MFNDKEKKSYNDTYRMEGLLLIGLVGLLGVGLVSTLGIEIHQLFDHILASLEIVK